jgi:hypothetical protein
MAAIRALSTSPTGYSIVIMPGVYTDSDPGNYAGVYGTLYVTGYDENVQFTVNQQATL